jgi:hypothetical protein
MLVHAADVVETLPTARLGDEFLSAVRMLSRDRLPGLVVSDEQGVVVGCVWSIDLLRLVLPRYTLDQPILARVFDENHADRIATDLVHTRGRDVVGELIGRAPIVRPRATVVELAWLEPITAPWSTHVTVWWIALVFGAVLLLALL